MFQKYVRSIRSVAAWNHVGRWASVFVAAAVALSLVGCSDSPEDKPLPEEKPEPEECGKDWVEAVPWSDVAAGVGIRDIAGDFTVQTLDGSWNFGSEWSGEDSYVFFIKVGRVPQVMEAWNADAAKLRKFFADSPPNVHYFFLSADDTREADVADLKGRMDQALETLEPAAAAEWKDRLHYVPEDPTALDGSLGAFQTEHRSIWFAIDRFQRWREVGSLYDFNSGTYEMRFLGKEAAGFNYERKLAGELERFCGTEVSLFDGTTHEGGWEQGFSTTVELAFPSAEEMAGFDSMAVYLYTACPGHLQGREAGCNEWDYAHHLMLCDEGDDGPCDTELVRYVTSYGREGEWITDVSSLLPLVGKGGARRMQYRGANGYQLHGKILLWNAGKPYRPVEARYLWGEGATEVLFDASYNDGRHEAVTFVVDDASVSHVELFASITGHGFGSTRENCSEFCNHQHEFDLNGTRFMRDHANQLGRYGCYEKVDEGVVPNQFGSWPFGRAGWCPGQDVKPWTEDVSGGLVSGENRLSYRGLFRGIDYPATPSGGGDYMPNVRVASWLIFYEAQAPK